MLEAVLGDNRALEAELAQQTEALQNLQQYLEKCRAFQQEEDLEELAAVAMQLHATSQPRLRRAFELLRTATYRSQRLREIGERFRAAADQCVLRKAFAGLVQVRAPWVSSFLSSISLTDATPFSYFILLLLSFTCLASALIRPLTHVGCVLSSTIQPSTPLPILFFSLFHPPSLYSSTH